MERDWKDFKTLYGEIEGARAALKMCCGHYVFPKRLILLNIHGGQVGRIETTFTTDVELLCCAVAPNGSTIVAGDKLGNVHFLQVKGKNYKD